MSEKITTLEKPNHLYTNSKLFNSLPEGYKLVQFKILNSMPLSEEEAYFYNSGIDQQGCIILEEIELALRDIDQKTKELGNYIDDKTLSIEQRKAHMKKFKEIAIKEIKLFDKEKALVAEADSLQIKTYF